MSVIALGSPKNAAIFRGPSISFIIILIILNGVRNESTKLKSSAPPSTVCVGGVTGMIDDAPSLMVGCAPSVLLMNALISPLSFKLGSNSPTAMRKALSMNTVNTTVVSAAPI